MRMRLIGTIALLPLCASCSSLGFSSRVQAVETVNMESYFAERLAAGRAHLREGRPTKAIEAFRQASYDTESRAEAYNGMAVAYSQMGRDDVARSLFMKAIDQDPSDERFRRNLARLEAQVMVAAQDSVPQNEEGGARAEDAIRKTPIENAAGVATNIPKARTRIVEVFVGAKPARPVETLSVGPRARLAARASKDESESPTERTGEFPVRIELTRTSNAPAASTARAVRPIASAATSASRPQPTTSFPIRVGLEQQSNEREAGPDAREPAYPRVAQVTAQTQRPSAFPLRVDLNPPRTVAATTRSKEGQTFPMKIDLSKQ